MAGSSRCVGLITAVSGLLLLPVLAAQSRGRPPPPSSRVSSPPHRGRATPALGPCRQGTFLHGNRCYDVRKEKGDYDTAVERCSSLDPGGQLALFKDAQTMDGLANIFSDCRFPPGVAWRKPTKKWSKRPRVPPGRCRGHQRNPKANRIPAGFSWIGLRRNASGTAAERRFHFADGSPLGSFSPWMPGQNPKAEDGKDCVATKLIGNQGWRRFSCAHQLRYICQSETNVNVPQNSEESTAAGNSLSTEITTPGMVGTTGRTYTYVTDRDGLPARQEAGTPTAQHESLTEKKMAGKAKKSSVNLWLLLPGLQITGMLILMVWGTVFAWKVTEGGTRPLSSRSNASVSVASDVPIEEQIPKHFEDPE